MKAALTVLTSLILIVTEGTVESSQLAQLVTLELVLALGNRSGLIKCVNTKIFDPRSVRRLTVSMTLWTSFFALLTLSSVSAMIRQ